MTKISDLDSDDGLEWFYTQAREYPLLAAGEEHDIDREKWRARDTILELFVTNESGLRFIHNWVVNLLSNPPELKSRLEHDHYKILRREFSDLLKDNESGALLNILRDQLEKRDVAGQHAEILDTLTKINLSPLLVSGFADVLLESNEAGEISSALRGWQDFWSRSTHFGLDHKAPAILPKPYRKALKSQLKAFFGARERLVNHNLRLVLSIAGKTQCESVPYLDRIQSGVMGLIRAAEKYDYRTGNRFSTYAYNWISQSVRRVVEDQRAIVRLPTGVTEQVNRLYRERLSHVNTTGEEASAQFLADRMDIEPEAVARLQQIGNLSVSLESTGTRDPDGPSLGDKLSGTTFLPPAARAEQISLNGFLMNCIKKLTPQEQSVVKLRWGLDHSAPVSRSNLAARLDLSSERVRQLEFSALAKLREVEEVAEAFSDYRG